MKKILLILPLLLCTLLLSCINEPLDNPEINKDLVDQELFNYLLLISDEPEEEEFNCIEFNYNFTIYIFDAELNLEEAVTVYDNSSFLILLGNLEPEQSISVNYPIAGTLNNGEAVDINSNEELYDAIKECSLEAQQRYCNNILKDCNWSVTPLEDHPNEFEDNQLTLNNDSTIALYHNSAIYYGTWLTLYIGDVLYINIDLNDDEAAEEFWNHNWKVISYTDTLITISNDQRKVSIEKNCNDICELESYEVCEIDDTPGIANFNLTGYIPCIAITPPQDPIAAVLFTFFETEEEALSETNAIDATSYENLENPQTLYVRITYKTSGELIEIKTISINAVPCTDD